MKTTSTVSTLRSSTTARPTATTRSSSTTRRGAERRRRGGEVRIAAEAVEPGEGEPAPVEALSEGAVGARSRRGVVADDREDERRLVSELRVVGYSRCRAVDGGRGVLLAA